MNNTESTTSFTSSPSKGFTLIEMLVAVAVAMIFLSGMLLSRGDFDATVRLSSISRDAALLARQAQTYGAGGGSGQLEVGKPHGIHLSGGSPKEIRLYSDGDSDGDGEPDGNGYGDASDTEIETFQLPEPYTISDFCVSNSSINNDCGSANSVSDLDIYFVRPSLAANFHSGSANVSSATQAAIEITHEASGSTELIIIDSTGYISTP